jgi:hypothetical protein
MRVLLSLVVCSVVVLGAVRCQEEEYDVPEKAPIVLSSKITTVESSKTSSFMKTVQSTTHHIKEQENFMVST